MRFSLLPIFLPTVLLFLLSVGSHAAHLDEDVTHTTPVVELALNALRGHGADLELSLDPLITSPEQREAIEWLSDMLDSNDTEEGTPVCQACIVS